MTNAEIHLEVLITLIADGFFALVDDGETRTVSAVKWALSEIERLTTENIALKSKAEQGANERPTPVNPCLAMVNIELLLEIRRLKNKCNSLWQAINQSTPEHYPSKDDLTWEVIE
jgi:hypothetical protein